MTQTGGAKEQWEHNTQSVNRPLIDSDPQSLLSVTLDVPLHGLWHIFLFLPLISCFLTFFFIEALVAIATLTPAPISISPALSPAEYPTVELPKSQQHPIAM